MKEKKLQIKYTKIFHTTIIFNIVYLIINITKLIYILKNIVKMIVWFYQNGHSLVKLQNQVCFHLDKKGNGQ